MSLSFSSSLPYEFHSRVSSRIILSVDLSSSLIVRKVVTLYDPPMIRPLFVIFGSSDAFETANTRIPFDRRQYDTRNRKLRSPKSSRLESKPYWYSNEALKSNDLLVKAVLITHGPV